MIKLYYFQDKKGKYRLRVRGANGRQVGRGWRAFKTLNDLRAHVLLFVAYAQGSLVVWETWWTHAISLKRSWHWRCRRLDAVMLGGGEGYQNKADCMETMITVREELAESYKKYGITRDK